MSSDYRRFRRHVQGLERPGRLDVPARRQGSGDQATAPHPELALVLAGRASDHGEDGPLVRHSVGEVLTGTQETAAFRGCLQPQEECRAIVSSFGICLFCVRKESSGSAK